jgi:hypothetical protein
MNDYKFEIGERVYYDTIINVCYGKIVGRRQKKVGLFKPKIKNVYIVEDSKTNVNFVFYEESLWKTL